MKPISEAYNMDCMEYMRRFPDKHFELAIIDPPYGIGAGSQTYGKKKKKHQKKTWDEDTPTQEYFNELFRISKAQIVWGGNYFDLPRTNGWIVWDKDKRKETTFSDGELAWTSFLSLLKIKKIRYDGFIGSDGDKIHPTQKPVALYKWLLHNYAKPGDKILDTHLGSGSSRIAAYDMGFDFYATELDKDYFDAQEKRFQNFKSQLKLF